MVEFIPFEPAHLARLQLQAAQEMLQPLLADPAYGESLVVPGLSWSGVAGGPLFGRVVGCAGILPQSPGRAVAWALIGAVPRHEWVKITAKVRAVLAEAHGRGFWRIEAIVREGFVPGTRWVRTLGFEIEGLLRAYAPDRADCFLYAKVDDNDGD